MKPVRIMEFGRRNLRQYSGWIVALGCAALLVGGCVTRSRARMEAQMAYLRGQNEALGRMQQQQQSTQNPTVRVVGPVTNPVVPWTPELTLARAIFHAGYTGSQPSSIIIRRQGQEIQIDLKSFLAGQDYGMQPGDTIELQR